MCKVAWLLSRENRIKYRSIGGGCVSGLPLNCWGSLMPTEVWFPREAVSFLTLRKVRNQKAASLVSATFFKITELVTRAWQTNVSRIFLSSRSKPRRKKWASISCLLSKCSSAWASNRQKLIAEKFLQRSLGNMVFSFPVSELQEDTLKKGGRDKPATGVKHRRDRWKVVRGPMH